MSNESGTVVNLKVWVIWHVVYEKVMSVHLTEAGAWTELERLIDARVKEMGEGYYAGSDFEYDEFEVKP